VGRKREAIDSVFRGFSGQPEIYEKLFRTSKIGHHDPDEQVSIFMPEDIEISIHRNM